MLRFDGQTAIITGAGSKPSLGSAYARLLASRGARLLVNDIAGEPGAEAVATAIRHAGGEAVANTDTVACEDGAQRIVEAALDAFGRIDIVINNAAISTAAPIDVMTANDIRDHIEVNLLGSMWVSRAAWPHLEAQRYGRIVNTTSGAMTGFAGQAAYATSKGGLWSLTRALAAEGMAHGIAVNAISPGAYTRLAASLLEDDSPLIQQARTSMPAELVAPVVAFLAHRACPVSGECLDAAGGSVQRTLMARTPGMIDPDLNLDAVAARWSEIMDEAGASTIGIATLDTSEWKFRPYAGTA